MSSQYFPPYTAQSENIKVKLDQINYVTKSDFQEIIHVDTSEFALKTNLNNLKTEIVPFPNDLANLSNFVKNDVVKKTEYNTLKTKVGGIDTISVFNSKNTDIESKITTAEGKIPDISNLASKTELRTDKIKYQILLLI